MLEQGELLIEGKTKKIFSVVADDALVIIESKDDITAGDGEKHDLLPNKGELSTRTTCNVFSFLREKRYIATAYRYRRDAKSFVAHRCDMIPLEVVVRREAYGSFLQRLPAFPKGAQFEVPIVEFFLKTTDRMYGDIEMPYDDPLLRWMTRNRSVLFDPHSPQDYGYIEMDIPGLGRAFRLRLEIESLARDIFEALEQQWDKLGCKLVDVKFEFGFDIFGKLRLSDLVDNDSWRLLKGGVHLDKQCYRDDADLADVASRYELVALLSEDFP